MSVTTGEDYMEPIPSCGTEAQTENPRYVNSEAERAESAIYHYTDIDIGIGVTSTGQASQVPTAADKPPSYESVVELPVYQSSHSPSGNNHHYTGLSENTAPEYQALDPNNTGNSNYSELSEYVGPDPARGNAVRRLPQPPKYDEGTTVAGHYDYVINPISTPEQSEEGHELAEYASCGEYLPVTPIVEAHHRVAQATSTSPQPQQANLSAGAVEAPANVRPRSWLPWSIITLILFCLPLGIPAVILSAQVGNDYKHGRYAIAKKKSRAAFVLNVVATSFFGLIILIAVGGIAVVLGLLAACCTSANRNDS